MNCIRFYLFLLLLILYLPVFSQHSESITLTAKITDSKLNPLDQLTASLHSVNDSLLLGKTLSNENGEFMFKTSSGHYFIKITGLDYNAFKTSVIEVKNDDKKMTLIAIALQPKVNALKEVLLPAREMGLK